MITLASEADLPAIAQIEAACFSMPWSLQGFKDALAQDNVKIWVAKDGEAVCGYLCMYCSLDEGEITNVAVSNDFRGRGIGIDLVKAAQDYARTSNLAQIVLEVRVSNAPAIKVYDQAGFVALGIRKGFYDKPKEDASIMAWENKVC